MNGQLRILIADDHDLVRRGMRALLEAKPGWQVCGEARNGREAVSKAKELNPELVVMDVCMPEMNGLLATRQILKDSPRTQVLVVTQHDSDQVVRDVVDAGARGFVLKSDPDQYVVVAVDALSRHKPFFTARATEMLMEGMAGPSVPETANGERLTNREREILQLLAEGQSSKAVASTLNISVKTAETHRANIMRKLGLHCVSELVRYAVRNNIIEA